jgi:hypothetical protein
MQHQPAGGAGYQDPLIAIRDGELALRRYYFPTGTKRIRLAAITRVEEYAMTKAAGRWRTWGSGDLVHWLNLDPGRWHKQQAFVVDLGRRAKPVVTPDDPDAFRSDRVQLAERGDGHVHAPPAGRTQG